MQSYELEYEAVINELLKNSIDVSKAYKYYDHPLSSEFNAYFHYCQKGLSVISSPEGVNIEPSRFYFIDSGEVNAKAFPRKNGYFRISINRGTVEKIYNLFCGYNSVLDDPELIEYKNLNIFFNQYSYQQSLDYITFQHSVLFIFFHELRHLIQFSNYESLNIGGKELNINDEAYVAKNLI
jgi:hypothetical protein